MLNQANDSSPIPGGAADTVLKVLVKGFSVVEHRLLEGAVKLSQRRPPRIDLVAEAHGRDADVIMIDATDPAAVQWANTQSWLMAKPVILAGAKTARPGHMAIDRHVKWPILPVLLYKALEQAPTAVAAPAATASPAAAHVTNRRVLIVDDSLAARAHLRSLLERMGVEVTEADTAEVGIDLAANGAFACVLMDVLMPGIDGFEACRRIKARARSGTALPVVMLTSKSSPFDRVRGKMAGCDTYLTKPVDPGQLHEVVARHISVARPVAAERPSPALSNFNPTPPKGLNPWPATS
jgi:two-component system, cell cycle response regulator